MSNCVHINIFQFDVLYTLESVFFFDDCIIHNRINAIYLSIYLFGTTHMIKSLEIVRELNSTHQPYIGVCSREWKMVFLSYTLICQSSNLALLIFAVIFSGAFR